MECAQRIGQSVEIYVNILKGTYKSPNPDTYALPFTFFLRTVEALFTSFPSQWFKDVVESFPLHNANVAHNLPTTGE